MTNPIRDPLLAAAKIIIGFFIVVAGIAIAGVAIALPALLLNQQTVLAELAKQGATAADATIFGPIVIILLCAAALMGLAIWFLLLLRRIVLTVGEGDPFAPANADRLARMGWITVGTQALSLPVGAMLLHLATVLKDAKDLHIEADVGVSGGAIVLILVLFILARVFRHGTAMRHDLEGTV